MLRTRVRAGSIAGFVMSLGFAVLLTVVQGAEALVPQLAPHAHEPAPATIRVPYAPVIQSVGAVREADRRDAVVARMAYEHAFIVPRGTVLDVNNERHRIALAFEAARRPASRVRVLATGTIFLTLFLMTSTYLRNFGPTRTRLLRSQLGLFTTIATFVVLAKLVLLFTPVSEFWIPLATVPLWCAYAFERRTAFLINVIMAFMTASLLLFDLPFLTVLITRGVAASLLFWNRKQPRQMILAGAAAGLIAAVFYSAVVTIFEGAFSPSADLRRGWESALVGCFVGGALSGILAHQLRQVGQRALGSVSRDRLIDLTDLEQPLLKKMAAEAPGSWEHARAMANLAEAAAAAIGADALLTRVGAYYHDLGKTIQPKYFVENLLPGERSPHEDLEPDVSADAIMAHVVQGTKLLRDGGLPEAVVEFAYTHHGTQVIEYFFHKCKAAGNPKKLSEDFFRYPGMKPQTKETAILMLVDSIEAASRTIQPPERAKLEEMIQRIVFTKLKSGQLDDSGLALEDMKILVVRMADTLVNMYHGRIKYPWQEQQERQRESAARTAAATPSGEAARVQPTDTTDDEPPRKEKPTEKPN